MDAVPRRSVLIGGLVAGAAAGLSAASASSVLAAGAGQGHADLALVGVTVVDPAYGRPQREMTVLITGEHISAVGPSRSLRPPPGARVMDLRGRYMIPGLCEMHAHSIGTERISPPLYVANGVTTVREMGASAVVSDWRRKVESGRLLGPRWVIAGPIIDGRPSLLVGPGEESSDVIPVATAAEARNAVRLVKQQGADFVKIYSRLPAEAFAAVAAESRRLGLRFLGHVPDLVPAEEAIGRGQRSIEHLHMLPLAVSARRDEVRRALGQISIEPGDYAAWFRQIHPIEWMAATSPSRRAAELLFERLARSRTWVTPTITMHQLVDTPEDAVVDDHRLRYIPAETRRFWNYVLENYYKPNRSATEIAQQRELYHVRLEFIRAMHLAGVQLLAGSEAGFVYSYPGFTLHDELAELVRAGLSPLEALRAATTEAATALGLQRSIAAIRPQRIADLVVLDADPLIDITNTRKIHAVVLRGRLIDATERHRLLADVADAAGAPGVDEQLPAAPGCTCHMPSGPRRG